MTTTKNVANKVFYNGPGWYAPVLENKTIVYKRVSSANVKNGGFTPIWIDIDGGQNPLPNAAIVPQELSGATLMVGDVIYSANKEIARDAEDVLRVAEPGMPGIITSIQNTDGSQGRIYSVEFGNAVWVFLDEADLLHPDYTMVRPERVWLEADIGDESTQGHALTLYKQGLHEDADTLLASMYPTLGPIFRGLLLRGQLETRGTAVLCPNVK